jgi:cobalt-zinc-cadmium efflux system membrane fusion protein
MTKHQLIVTGAIAGAGLLLALLILLAPSSAPIDEHGHGSDHAGEDGEHGPHGGRLLDAEDRRALEVALYEAGMRPELRLYPFVDGEPTDPSDLSVTVELHRLGGVVDTVRFRPAGAFLRGDTEIYEPHAFDVVVRGTWHGEPVRWAYASIEGRVEMPGELAEANGVVVEEAGPAPIRTALDLPGEVQLNADRVARVAPRVSGTVVAVPAGLGEHVEAGATLAVVESRELGQAQAAYVESLHRMELAQAAYERERRLHERRISARKEYEQARHDLEEAELAKQSAEHALRALGVPPAQLAALGVEPEGVAAEREVRAPLPHSLTRYAVRAPLGGEVIDRQVAIGQHVTGTEEAFTIADLSTVWVEVTVYARDLDAVRPGQDVVVHARGDSLTGPVGRGTVRFVGALVGEATRTARALVTLPNLDGRWRPGLFVSAEVVQDEETVPVAVRREAIQTWRGMPVVFARFGGTFEVRPVTLGRTSGDFVEVTRGIEAGQPYAAEGAFLLKADLEKAGASHDH